MMMIKIKQIQISKLYQSILSNKQLIYSFIFLWLAISGGVVGRQYTPLLLANSFLMGYFVSRGWSVSDTKGRAVGLLIFMVTSFSLTINGAWLGGWPRLLELLALWGIYQVTNYIPINKDAIQAGATYAFWVVMAIGVLIADNSNVVAMNGWSLFFLSGGVPWIVAIILIALLGSAGGVLAIVVGLGYKWLKGRVIIVIVGAILILLLINPDTIIVRLQLIMQAWEMFSNAPIIGGGLGSFRGYVDGWGAISSHNIIFDVMAEGGLVGLLFFIMLIGRAFKRCYNPYLMAFMIHAMVDSPHLFYLPLVGLIFSIRVYCNDDLQTQKTP